MDEQTGSAAMVFLTGALFTVLVLAWCWTRATPRVLARAAGRIWSARPWRRRAYSPAHRAETGLSDRTRAVIREWMDG